MRIRDSYFLGDLQFMYIEVFQVFCDLAETGSFSKAAVLNSITQSAVSQQIRSLETKFQVTLVERGKRNFALTAEGQAFLEASKEILGIYNNLDRRLHELRDVVAGELKIAAIYSIGLHELPPTLKAFREKYADVELHVEYRRSQQVYAHVLAGDVDFGLVAYPVKRNGLNIDIFSEDRLVLICHPNHPLASRKQIKVEELSGEKFIAFEPDLPTRKVIDKHLREHGVAMEHVMEFDNIETVKRAVEIDHGIAIVPQATVQQEVRQGTLASVPFKGKEFTRPLAILHRKGRVLTPAMKKFIETLSNEILDGPKLL